MIIIDMDLRLFFMKLFRKVQMWPSPSHENHKKNYVMNVKNS